MNDKDAVAAYLDSIAEEAKADFPGEGEFTIMMYVGEMAKRGVKLSYNAASHELARFMESGKWTVRDGRRSDGRSAKIYKPILK